MNSIQMLKAFDRFIGPILIKLLPSSPRNRNSSSPNLNRSSLKRLLVIRPGGIGDAALLLPGLKAAWNALSQPRIDILCEPRNQGVFHATDFISSIYSYKNPVHLLKTLSTSYDAIIDTEQSHFLSAFITRLGRTGLRAGFKTCGRQKMYSISTTYSHSTYEADQFWKLFCDSLNIQGPLIWDNKYFKKTKLPDKVTRNLSSSFACLFPGATVKERHWPAERWAHVADHLHTLGIQPVFLGTQNESEQIKAASSACKKAESLNLCSKISLAQTAALFQSAKLLVSTDSGILHIGVICGLPTISLFGSGIEKKWGPKGRHHQIINKNLSCSPCTRFGTTLPCPNRFACMDKISAIEVIEAINHLTLP